MRILIRPGKITCAGIVVIFMVLPNSIWKGADAKHAPEPKLQIEAVKKKVDSAGRRVKFQSGQTGKMSLSVLIRAFAA